MFNFATIRDPRTIDSKPLIAALAATLFTLVSLEISLLTIPSTLNGRLWLSLWVTYTY